MAQNKKLIEKLKPIACQFCEGRSFGLGRPLGAGATSAVFEVATGEGLRALKVCDPLFLEDPVRGETTKRRQKLILDRLTKHGHPHLVEIFEGGEYAETLYLLMQRAPGNCLTDVLKKVPRQPIRKLIDQITQAALFLESRGLCHRDIKSDNIVVADDFGHATLLDLGVIRDVDDDVGSGTDDGGQLPFVATARYSSPEYMFRLMPPSRDLWRALTFYQLGAVLHDLIMRAPIFEDVVRRAHDNRYLVAHAVATEIPSVSANDVPRDLVLLAERALDKDPGRRLASVTWDDFRESATDDSLRLEAVLGLRDAPLAEARSKKRQTFFHRMVEDVNRQVDDRLVKRKIHARHEVQFPLGKADVLFTWRPPHKTFPADGEVQIKIALADFGTQIKADSEGEYRRARKTVFCVPSFPVVTVAYQGAADVPETLVDALVDAFLRQSASVMEKYINIKSET